MPVTPDTSRLVDFSQKFKGPIQRGLYDIVGRPLEAALSINSLNRIYDNYSSSKGNGDNFFQGVLRQMNIAYEITDDDLARIPKEGPVIVVANHPLGGLDGIALGAILTHVRQDVRIVANSLLWHIKEIRPWLFLVNPFGGDIAVRQNIKGLKQTINYLRNGGCVGTFPSGTVSHLNLRKREVTDPQWSPNTARFIRMSNAMVVPMHFEGRNSNIFQLAGLIHPLLRTAMLPREMINKMDDTIRVRVGNPIPYRKLQSFPSDDALTDFLRLNTYVLRERDDGLTRKSRRFPLPLKIRAKKNITETPIAKPIATVLLKQDIDGLPEDTCILEHDCFSIYFAKSKQIPNVLQEIGRLRERTFREVHEGTGKSQDLDRFDSYYYHLFMWDRKKDAIVGAYRMGKTDEILAEYGPKGLYTTTLFKFKPGALDYFNPGFELGRSFIVAEYQRKHATLALLWRAINRVIARNPNHHVLFGPVSITQEYQAISKDLMVQFLKNSNSKPEIAAKIKPRNPMKRARLRPAERAALRESVRNIDDVSALVAEIEMDRKGVPILLRHYLKLNGQLLSFNIDPDFNQCLDGLIMVDFTHTNNKLIKQYMGADLWQKFAEHHGLPC